jgi:hypothetical protein
MLDSGAASKTRKPRSRCSIARLLYRTSSWQTNNRNETSTVLKETTYCAHVFGERKSGKLGQGQVRSIGYGSSPERQYY